LTFVPFYFQNSYLVGIPVVVLPVIQQTANFKTCQFMQKLSRLLFLSLVTLACSKNDNNNSNPNHSCDFAVAQINAPSDGSVKYEANISGTGSISTLVIKTAAGTDSTINSPTLPLQKSFDISSGTAIAISAKGSTTGGRIEIKYTFTATGGGSVSTDKEECGN